MNQLLRTIERIAIAAGLLLLFLVALELLQAYQTLAGFHPVAGYAFLLVLALLLSYLLWQLRVFALLRTVPDPPDLPVEGAFPNGAARRFVVYMKRVAQRFESNPLLQESFHPHLVDLNTAIGRLEKSMNDPAGFRAQVLLIERELIGPMLAHLDKQAETVVSDNVGIVSVGTALSPYRSVDMIIVLSRNVRMVNRILHIYRSKPSVQESWRVFYDIARVVAAVNILNSMDQVWTGIGRHVPMFNTWGEALSEGLFSGLLTSVAGHAAIDRSRSYHSWSREEAVRAYKSRLERWGVDIWKLLIHRGIHQITRSFGKVKPPAETSEGSSTRKKNKLWPFGSKPEEE